MVNVQPVGCRAAKDSPVDGVRRSSLLLLQGWRLQ